MLIIEELMETLEEVGKYIKANNTNNNERKEVLDNLEYVICELCLEKKEQDERDKDFIPFGEPKSKEFYLPEEEIKELAKKFEE